MATDPPHQGAAGRTSPIRPTYTLLLGALCRVAQALAPSLLFTWDQTMVEVMKIMVISIKRSHACTATVRAPNLQQATTDPCLRRRLPDTHRQVSCGVTVPFSWVLVHKVLLCPPRVYFSVLCKFWWG